MIKWQSFLKAHKTLIAKIDVKKMKIGFGVEQCLHALSECQEDVTEITKNYTKAVSGDFLFRDFFVLAKIDFMGYVTF